MSTSVTGLLPACAALPHPSHHSFPLPATLPSIARQELAAVQAGNRRGFFEDMLRVIGEAGALSIVGHTLGRLDAPMRERLAARGAPVPLLLSLPARIGDGWQVDGEFLWKTANESMEPLLAAIGPLPTA